MYHAAYFGWLVCGVLAGWCVTELCCVHFVGVIIVSLSTCTEGQQLKPKD
jgi:hypothetical protein